MAQGCKPKGANREGTRESPRKQKKLLTTNPNNIVHLMLGRISIIWGRGGLHYQGKVITLEGHGGSVSILLSSISHITPNPSYSRDEPTVLTKTT